MAESEILDLYEKKIDDEEESHQDVEYKEKAVKFRDTLESIRLVTVENFDTNYRSFDLNTLDDITRENVQFIELLIDLREQANAGRDVRIKFNKIMKKFELVTRIGFLLAKQNKSKSENENENENENTNEVSKNLNEENGSSKSEESSEDESGIEKQKIPDRVGKKSSLSSVAEEDSFGMRKEEKSKPLKPIMKNKACPSTQPYVPKKPVSEDSESPELNISRTILNQLNNPKIDICFCFDSCNPLRKYMFEIASTMTNKVRVRVAFICWSSKNQLKKSSFAKLTSNFSEACVNFKTKSFSDVRDEILSLDWNSSSLKLYIYFRSFQDQFQNQNLMTPYLNDETNSLMKHQQIHRKEIYPYRTREEESKLEAIEMLESHINTLKNFHFHAGLNDLKRCVIDDYRSLHLFFKRSGRLLRVNYPTIGNYYIQIYKKEDLNKKPELVMDKNFKNIRINYIIDSKQSSEFSRTAVAEVVNLESSYCQLFKSTSKICLEKLDLDDHSRPHLENIYIQMIDIFLTAKKLADLFNSRTKNFSVLVPEVFLVNLNEQDIESTELAMRSSNLPEICSYYLQNDQIKNYLDAFTHFTYEYTKQELLVTDLRTGSEGYFSKELSLHEPIIFSKKRNYGCSDLGIDGINWFIDNHKCVFCYLWKTA